MTPSDDNNDFRHLLEGDPPILQLQAIIGHLIERDDIRLALAHRLIESFKGHEVSQQMADNLNGFINDNNTVSEKSKAELLRIASGGELSSRVN